MLNFSSLKSRTKLEHHNTSLKDLEHEQTISTQLREKCTRLKAELQDTHAAEQELLMENDNIKGTVTCSSTTFHFDLLVVIYYVHQLN